MYDSLLTSDSADFISERFNHYDRFLNFMAITGKVLSTEKRSEFNVDTRYSSDVSSSGSTVSVWQSASKYSLVIKLSYFKQLFGVTYENNAKP